MNKETFTAGLHFGTRHFFNCHQGLLSGKAEHRVSRNQVLNFNDLACSVFAQKSNKNKAHRTNAHGILCSKGGQPCPGE